MRELLVIADFEVAIGVVVQSALQVPEVLVDAVLGAGAEEHELRVVLERVEERVSDEMQALLCVEAADIADDRAPACTQQHALAQRRSVVCAIRDGCGVVVPGDVGIDLRVPHLVIEPVQDADELVLVQVQCVAEAKAEVGMTGLPGVMRRNGRDEVRVQDRATHQVDRMPVELVAHPVGGAEVVEPIQAGSLQDPGPGRALVPEVVDRVADALVGEAGTRINLV